MNYLILIAGIVALIATIGHFTMGKKRYLKPVMDADIDIIPKKVMQSLFHYMSVFLVLSTLILFAGCSQLCPLYDYVNHMIRFIAVAYAFFGLSQLLIGLTSGVKGGLFKIFQWVFWILIAIFASIGSI